MKIIKTSLSPTPILLTFALCWALAAIATTGVLQLIITTSTAFLAGVLTTQHYLHRSEQSEQSEQNTITDSLTETNTASHQSSSSFGVHLETQSPTADVPEPSTLLVDESILQQIIKDTDVSVMPELIKFYIIESKDRVETIVSAAHNKDLYALEFEAHTLGSSSLTLGNVALSTLAREIELHCLQQEFYDALQKADSLPNLAHDSFIALEKRNAQGFTK